MPSIITDLSLLRKKSEPVNSVEEAKDLIIKIKSVLANIENGMGVAAIQIGIPKKVAVIRIGKDKTGKDQFLELINAELEKGEDEFIYLNEGCLSIPGYFQDTKRYRQITIKNQVIDGDKFREERQVYYYPLNEDDHCTKGDPRTCIAVQHEIDHWNSITILERAVKREPIVRFGNGVIKTGRNDPCPCGKKDNNGKPIKYKKCCGNGKLKEIDLFKPNTGGDYFNKR